MDTVTSCSTATTQTCFSSRVQCVAQGHVAEIEALAHHEEQLGVCAYMCVCMYVCVCIYVCMSACMSVCSFMCVFTYACMCEEAAHDVQSVHTYLRHPTLECISLHTRALCASVTHASCAHDGHVYEGAETHNVVMSAFEGGLEHAHHKPRQQLILG